MWENQRDGIIASREQTSGRLDALGRPVEDRLRGAASAGMGRREDCVCERWKSTQQVPA